jgi:hypothetical protein
MNATTHEQDTKGLRRRMVTMALGIKPRHLRSALTVPSYKVTAVLSGTERLRPEETGKLARVVSRRVKELFG